MTELINKDSFDKEGWVVIYTPSNAHFVGKRVDTASDDEKGVVTLSPGFNWLNESVMAAPGQMMIMRQPTPLGPTLESSVITLNYIGIQHVDKWDEDTREELFDRVKDIIKNMEEQKRQRSLEKSNLVIAQPGVNPNILKELQGK